MSVKQVFASLHGNRWRLWWGLVVMLVVWVWSRPSEPSLQPFRATTDVAVPVKENRSGVARQQPGVVPAEVKRVALLAAARNPFRPQNVQEPAAMRPVDEPEVQETLVQDVVWEPPSFSVPQFETLPAVTEAVPAMEFVGRMQSPDGEQIIYARVAGQERQLRKGELLSNGYRVGRITTAEVEFLPEAAHGERMYMDLPPPPRYEVR